MKDNANVIREAMILREDTGAIMNVMGEVAMRSTHRRTRARRDGVIWNCWVALTPAGKNQAGSARRPGL